MYEHCNLTTFNICLMLSPGIPLKRKWFAVANWVSLLFLKHFFIVVSYFYPLYGLTVAVLFSPFVPLSLKMVLLWTAGDVFKTTYFVINESPAQFWVCGMTQILIDIAILMQVGYYGLDSRAKVGWGWLLQEYVSTLKQGLLNSVHVLYFAFLYFIKLIKILVCFFFYYYLFFGYISASVLFIHNVFSQMFATNYVLFVLYTH